MVCLQPPRHWFRCVDDSFVVQQQTNNQGFMEHINSIDLAIKITVEGNQGNGAIPFLDTLVTPEADTSLSFTVYCKPTHADQYLKWDIHHNLSAKYSVIGTLTHRAKTVCTRPELFQKELQHLREALVRYKYPNWAISRVLNKYINNNWEGNNNHNNLQDNIPNPNATMDQTQQSRDNTNTSQDNHNPSTCTEAPPARQKPSIGYVVIPYTKSIAESFKNICGKYGIHTYFNGNTTIKQIWMKLKDQDPKDKKSGVIYSYQCGDIACSEEYIGDMSRTLVKDTRSP